MFLLFAIPVGGGIPAGVILAQKDGIDWLTMSLIYLVSDIALACVFEPIVIFLRYLSQHYPLLAKMRDAMRHSTNKTIARYGAKPGPILLVTIAFGVDPMTGRAAALAAGHNFISGWAFAIAGDMLFFWLVAVSTIFLNGILGDGTWTAIIIMVLMMVVPAVIRKIRERRIT